MAGTGTEARGHGGAKALAAEAIRRADGLLLLEGWTRRHGLDRSTWERTHNGVVQRVEVDAIANAYLYEEGEEVLLAAPEGGGLEYVLRYANDPTIEDRKWAGTDHGPAVDRDDERVEIGADGRPAGREAEGSAAATPRTGPAPSGTDDFERRLASLERVQRLHSEGCQGIVDEQRRHERRLDDLTDHLRELVGVVDRLTVQTQALAERVDKLERWTGVPKPASELLEAGAGQDHGQDDGQGGDAAQPRTGPAPSGTDSTNPHETAAGPERSGPPPVLRLDLTATNRRLLDEVNRLVRSGQAQRDVERVAALRAIENSFPHTLEVIARLLAVGKVLAITHDDGPPAKLAAMLEGARLPWPDAVLLMDAWRTTDAGTRLWVIERDRIDEGEALERIAAKRAAVREGGAA